MKGPWQSLEEHFRLKSFPLFSEYSQTSVELHVRKYLLFGLAAQLPVYLKNEILTWKKMSRYTTKNLQYVPYHLSHLTSLEWGASLWGWGAPPFIIHVQQIQGNTKRIEHIGKYIPVYMCYFSEVTPCNFVFVPSLSSKPWRIWSYPSGQLLHPLIIINKLNRCGMNCDTGGTH